MCSKTKAHWHIEQKPNYSFLNIQKFVFLIYIHKTLYWTSFKLILLSCGNIKLLDHKCLEIQYHAALLFNQRRGGGQGRTKG